MNASLNARNVVAAIVVAGLLLLAAVIRWLAATSSR